MDFRATRVIDLDQVMVLFTMNSDGISVLLQGDNFIEETCSIHRTHLNGLDGWHRLMDGIVFV